MKCSKFLLIMVMAITMLSMVGCSEDDSRENVVSTTTSANISTNAEIAATTTFQVKIEEGTTTVGDGEEIIYDYDSAFSEKVDLDNEKKDDKKLASLEPKICGIEYDDILFFSEGLCPYQDSRTGLWGYLDTDFNIAIKPVFVEVCCFSEGLAAVHDGVNWGFIDASGKYVISSIYENVYYKYDFHEGTSGTYRNGMRGFINGYAAVECYDNYVYYIDKSGNIVNSEAWYLNMRRCGNILFNISKGAFCNEYAKETYDIPRVHYSTGTGTDLRDDDKYSITDDYILVSDLSDNEYIMNSDGNIIFSYADLEQGNCYATVITNESCTYQRYNNNLYQTAVYDFYGNEIIPFYYEGVFPICCNGDVIYYIGYFKNGESELLDRNGNVLNYDWFDTSQNTAIRCCDMLGSAQGNYAVVYTKDNMKLLNLDTNMVVLEYSDNIRLPLPDRSSGSNYEFDIEDNLGIVAMYNDYLLIQDNNYDYLIFNMNGDVVGEYSGKESAFDVSMQNLENGILHGLDASGNNSELMHMNIFSLDGLAPTSDMKSEKHTASKTATETVDYSKDDLTSVLMTLIENPDANIDQDVLDSITSIEIVGNEYYCVNIPANDKYNFEYYSVGYDSFSFIVCLPNNDIKIYQYGSLSNIDFVKRLKNLTSLTIAYNEISDISALESMPHLTSINLSGNQITDISPLSNLTNVVDIDISFNNIKKIGALKKMTKLDSLMIDENNISDISTLKDLTNLTFLSIGYNNVSDISVLKNLTNLTFLSIGSNPISEIEPIMKLDKLGYLSVYNTNVSESDYDKLRRKFPEEYNVIGD